jgi:hypothetical protein
MVPVAVESDRLLSRLLMPFALGFYSRVSTEGSSKRLFCFLRQP